MKKNKLEKLYREWQEFAMMMKTNQLDTYSSSAAFFIFVSLIPFFILVLSIIPYTPVPDSDIYDVLLKILPEELYPLGYNIMLEVTTESFAILSISMIGVLWSASRGIQSLKSGLNKIHGQFEKRNFVFLRLNAVIYTVIFIISMVSLFIVSTMSRRLIDYLMNSLGISHESPFGIFMNTIFSYRYLIIIPIVFLVVLIFFYALPNKSPTLKSQIPGALFVTILWYVFSKLFSLYNNLFNSFSMYGSLSFVIVAMLWLYSCMYIFFIGAQGNYYLSMKKKTDKINS